LSCLCAEQGIKGDGLMIRMITIAAATAGFVLSSAGASRAQGAVEKHDTFYYIGEINKASIVMLAETGLLPKGLAGRIANGIRTAIDSQAAPGSPRPTDYFDFEPMVIAAAGPDASRMHTGRSRQDIESTYQRQYAREALLAAWEALNESRGKLLVLAGRHLETIVPAYTLDVQAQPTSLAHYLAGMAEALDRDSDRLQATYSRLNRSPLGAAALATSGFPLDRRRLAALLGFDDVVENSYDANHMSSVDFATELVGVLATSALHIGQFSQDLLIQYHEPTPWIMIKEGEGLTTASSIMPQKRNPNVITGLREVSSTVVGDAGRVFLLAHNTSVGDYDYRRQGPVVETTDRAQAMYLAFSTVLDNLIVYPARSLAEVNADYSTMTEVADTLLRDADVPFRIGHHFASELTTYGRGHGLVPKDIPYAEAVRIYKDVTGERLPLTPAQLQHCFDPTYVVLSRRGLGGSQPEEVKRMLADGQTRLAAAVDWVRAQRSHLQSAQASLDREFDALRRQ
jgi:argininosuccinate lyase